MECLGVKKHRGRDGIEVKHQYLLWSLQGLILPLVFLSFALQKPLTPGPHTFSFAPHHGKPIVTCCFCKTHWTLFLIQQQNFYNTLWFITAQKCLFQPFSLTPALRLSTGGILTRTLIYRFVPKWCCIKKGDDFPAVSRIFLLMVNKVKLWKAICWTIVRSFFSLSLFTFQIFLFENI